MKEFITKSLNSWGLGQRVSYVGKLLQDNSIKIFINLLICIQKGFDHTTEKRRRKEKGVAIQYNSKSNLHRLASTVVKT